MDSPSKIGAPLFTLAGITAAFGVASCCAIPLLLAGFGISASWLVGVAMLAVPYRTPLLVTSAIALIGGAALLWQQQRAAMVCRPGEACMPRSVRLLTLLGLILGGVLVWAGYTYV